MSLTNYYEAKILNHVNNVATLTPEAHLHLGLSTTTPTDTGTNVTEPSGGSYARQQVTNGATFWATATAGNADNLAAVVYPEASAAWGTITYMVCWDAAEANVLWYGALTAQKVIGSGDQLTFSIGEVDQNLD
jgi:hypothetical protein